MDDPIIETTLRFHVEQMCQRLQEAAGIATAARACADAGNLGKAIEIALDVEQLMYEVNVLLNAASLVRRISDI